MLLGSVGLTFDHPEEDRPITINTTIQKDDIGTNFDLTFKEAGVAVDISGATTKEIILRAPDATKTTYAGTFISDGTDGQLRYTTVATDIDQDGHWHLQGKIIMPAGTFFSSVEDFYVKPNL